MISNANQCISLTYRKFEKDPNADLESFENFGQDFTKSPDLHQNPPEISPPTVVPEDSYSYIPIETPITTLVPYIETKVTWSFSIQST